MAAITSTRLKPVELRKRDLFIVCTTIYKILHLLCASERGIRTKRRKTYFPLAGTR